MPNNSLPYLESFTSQQIGPDFLTAIWQNDPYVETLNPYLTVSGGLVIRTIYIQSDADGEYPETYTIGSLSQFTQYSVTFTQNNIQASTSNTRIARTGSRPLAAKIIITNNNSKASSDISSAPIVYSDGVKLSVLFESNGGYPFTSISFIVNDITSGTMVEVNIPLTGVEPGEIKQFILDNVLYPGLFVVDHDYVIACFVSNELGYSPISNSVAFMTEIMAVQNFTADSGLSQSTLLKWEQTPFLEHAVDEFIVKIKKVVGGCECCDEHDTITKRFPNPGVSQYLLEDIELENGFGYTIVMSYMYKDINGDPVSEPGPDSNKTSFVPFQQPILANFVATSSDHKVVLTWEVYSDFPSTWGIKDYILQMDEDTPIVVDNNQLS